MACELHFCLSTSVSLSPVAIIAILRISLVEVFKHSLCSLCAEHVMMLNSAGLKTLSPATDLCMHWGHSQYFWIFGSKVWSDLLQSFFKSARCSEILDNAEYPQIPPRQNFYTGKRPWLGNTEHISLILSCLFSGLVLFFCIIEPMFSNPPASKLWKKCTVWSYHIYCSICFPTLIACLPPACDRSSAPCNVRKIGSLFLVVVVGTAVIKGIF